MSELPFISASALALQLEHSESDAALKLQRPRAAEKTLDTAFPDGYV